MEDEGVFQPVLSPPKIWFLFNFVQVFATPIQYVVGQYRSQMVAVRWICDLQAEVCRLSLLQLFAVRWIHDLQAEVCHLSLLQLFADA